MGFPEYRPRRLRKNAKLRGLIQEHELSAQHLIYPIFVREDSPDRVAVPSMPGIFQLSVDRALAEVEEVVSLSIPAVLLFGIPIHKDEAGSGAWDENGIVQKEQDNPRNRGPRGAQRNRRFGRRMMSNAA